MKRNATARLLAVPLLLLLVLAGCHRVAPVAATPSHVMTPVPTATLSPTVTPSPVPLYPPLWKSIYSSPAEQDRKPEAGIPFVLYYWNDYGACILTLDEAFAREFLTLNAQAESVNRGEDYEQMSVFVYPEGYTERSYGLLTNETGGYQLYTDTDRYIQADALCVTLLDLLEEERGVRFTPRRALQDLTAATVYYQDDLLSEQTDPKQLAALEELIQTAVMRGAPRQCNCALSLVLTTADGSTYTLGLDILHRALSLSYGQHFYFGSSDDAHCALVLLDTLGLTLPSIDIDDYPYPEPVSPQDLYESQSLRVMWFPKSK